MRIRVDSKSFPAVGERPKLDVLTGVDLRISPRSFVVITGPSGCGKSTLLNIVAGLDDDYEGGVEFEGQRPKLSFMFQTPRLLPWRTVRQNIELALDNPEKHRERINQLIDAVGLSDAEAAYPERLSLGMQRRAALARAFVVEPDLLLMDEPFVSLDDPSALALRALLLDLWNKRPTTVLFITHDRDEAVMLATRLIRVDGKPAKVVSDQLVALTPEQRQDRDAVHAARAALFGD